MYLKKLVLLLLIFSLFTPQNAIAQQSGITLNSGKSKTGHKLKKYNRKRKKKKTHARNKNPQKNINTVVYNTRGRTNEERKRNEKKRS